MKSRSLIRTLRTLSGISQEELARIAGISQSSISRVESGRRPLRKYELEKLSQVFHVPLEAFGSGSFGATSE